MCGQFYISKDVLRTLRNYAPVPEFEQESFDFGNIYPSSKAFCLMKKENAYAITIRQFGIEYANFKKRLINARAETVCEKPMFSYDFTHHRVLVPASAFYEWTPEKEKVTFFEKEENTMFLAGFFHKEQFVLLTTEANDSMKPFHHRMPLIIRQDDVRDWLFDEKRAKELLHRVPRALDHKMSHKQGKLF